MDILLLALLAASPAARAHGGHTAAFELQELPSGWIISAHFPRSTADRALEERLGLVVLDNLDPVAYREAVVAYFRDTVRVSADGGPLQPWGAGGIRLGDHQTDLRLSLPELPAAVETVEVELAAFTEDASQVQVLRVLRAGRGQVARAVLTAADGYRARLEVDPG